MHETFQTDRYVIDVPEIDSQGPGWGMLQLIALTLKEDAILDIKQQKITSAINTTAAVAAASATVATAAAAAAATTTITAAALAAISINTPTNLVASRYQ